MALHHAAPGELINVRPLGNNLRNERTHVFFKTDLIEAIRIVLKAEDKHHQKAINGELTVQCLEGSVVLHAMDKDMLMKVGDLLYLKSGEAYSINAVEDASLLVTMMIEREQKD